MFHVPCASDRGSFASLVEVLREQGVVQCLGVLQAAGVKSAWDLENRSRSELRSLIGDIALDTLLASRRSRQVPARSDVPVVHPYARGSLQRLGSNGGPNAIDLAQADQEFLDDRYAKTSRAPRESRWTTWQTVCSLRGLEPIPVTVELINKVGAVFKAARYRSASQYFAVAKSMRMEAGHHWCQALELARAQALRSIGRGMGPAEPKLDLHLESAPTEFDAALQEVAAHAGVPQDARLPFMGATAVSASWFLLRGIEISNVQCRDVTFRSDLRQVTVQLPVSKVDQEAKGCSRTHCCICSPTHTPTCLASTPPALMFTPLQKCSCKQGHERLCVFHALLNVVVDLRKKQAFRPEAYLFGNRGQMPTARQISVLAKCCAVALNQVSLDEWHSGALDRWAQHSFRVAGAQFLARAGIDVAVIQLIGRWGSNAIFRYVQTAAFVPERTARVVAVALGNGASLTDPTSPTTPAPGNEQKDLQQLVRSIVSECISPSAVIVRNPRTKIAHKPSTSESALDSSCWSTACGKWKYGLSRCVRNLEVLSGYKACRACFGSPKKAEESASATSEESASDSSSGCE